VSYKALFVSVALALAWTGAALWVLRPVTTVPAPVSAPMRFFVINAGLDSYRIQAHETRQRDACTIFVRAGQEIAGVCGTHTWSEAVESDEAPKGTVY
jgi:hypothetical protein